MTVPPSDGEILLGGLVENSPIPMIVVSRDQSQVVRGRGRVLVIEDEQAIRTLVGRVLEDAGYQVLLAPEGLRGVELFQQHADIVVVIADLTMPRMDGWEVLVRLREMRPDIPVVLMSGYTELNVPPQLKDIEKPAFVRKPFRPEELVGKVNGVLSAPKAS